MTPQQVNSLTQLLENALSSPLYFFATVLFIIGVLIWLTWHARGLFDRFVTHEHLKTIRTADQSVHDHKHREMEANIQKALQMGEQSTINIEKLTVSLQALSDLVPKPRRRVRS